jgi:hypothetical protein
VAQRYWSASHTSLRSFSVSARLQSVDGEGAPCGSRVYGPSTDNLKQAFLEELRELSQVPAEAWLLTGAEDKNNDRLNRRLMGQFHSFLNTAQP